MSGFELFLESGTWWFFIGQIAVVILVVYLYIAQGKEEQKAIEQVKSEESNQ